MVVFRNLREVHAASPPGSDGRRLAGSVTGFRSASPARLAGAAALLVLACLAISPQAGAQNQLPTASSNTVTTNEDTAYTFTDGDFRFSDADLDTLAKVKIVTPPGAGTLARDGTAVTANQEISKADIDGNKLVFTPAANANGSNYASFTFKVNDGTAESASSYTMTIDVSAVNDPPTASSNTVTTNEDTAYTFDAGDFRFSDVDAGAALAKVKIVTPPGAGTLARDGTAVTANQEISKADIDGDRLVFTPAANAYGVSYASFTFKVNDGTAESASSYTMTIDVYAVNDPPTASSNTVATNEDTAYTFDAGDFRFSDVDAGGALAKVKIVTPPGAGTLARSGTAVTANQEISRADIDGNKLVFTPAANANGSNYASFTFKVNDGTAESASSYTMTIDVSAVNDPPIAADGEVTTNEDTPYTFEAGDFRFSDVDAGAALAKVKIVTPPGAGTLARDGTAVTANQEISRADIDGDRLVFTPAANANGVSYASFTFKVNDGTAESASSYTMTIDVYAVNDPPTAVDGEVTTIEDTPYSFSAEDFNFSDVVEGAGQTALDRYLSQAAPDRTTRSSDRVRVIGSASQQDRNRVVAAVRMVNAALPEDAKLAVDPLRTDLSLQHGMSGRTYFVTGDELPDTIHVEFVPGRDPTGGTAAARSFDLVDRAYVAFFQGSNSYRNEREAIILLAHEIMHALGIGDHVPASFQSIMKGTGEIHAVSQGGVRQPMSVLYPVDREALRALYSDDAASLGPWSSTSLHIHGNAPHAGFGVAFRNGYAEPWAYGYLASYGLETNPALSGIVTWNGNLVGFTPNAEAVMGDAAIRVDISTLRGTAAFTALEHWGARQAPGAEGTGMSWGDGDLRYTLAVSSNDSASGKASAAPTFWETGGDEGRLTGVFTGQLHEGAAGTLERGDLTAAFGASR